MALGLLAVSGIASASPVSDLRAGDSLWLHHGTASGQGDSGQLNDVVVSKAPGSLDFDVNLLSLGIDYDLVVHVHGTATSAHSVVWSFDAVLPSVVLVNLTSWATEVTGTIHAEVASIPGTSAPTCGGTPCPYSVRVTEASETSVVVYGHDAGTHLINPWKQPVTTSFSMFGGGPRPVLTGLELQAPRINACSTATTRTYQGRVVLAFPAPGGGSQVDISTNHVAAFPAHLFVPAGATSLDFAFTISASYVGTIRVDAASGGAMRSQYITVNPAPACLTVDPRWLIQDLTPLFPCPSCIEGLQVNQQKDILADDSGAYLIDSHDGKWQKVDSLVGQHVTSATLGALGDLAGTLEASQEVAFYLRHGNGWRKPSFVDGFAPDALGAWGAIPGFMVNNNGTYPAIFNQSEIVPLGVGYPGSAIALNHDGIVAGDVQVNQRSRVFVANGQSSSLLADNGLAQYVGGLNEAGDLAGWYEDPRSGLSMPFVLWAAQAKPETLKLPGGFASAAALDVGENRGVLVRGWTKGQSGVFLYQQGRGYLAIDKQIASKHSIVVDDVLGTDNQLDIAARGTIDGKPAVFILWRENQ